MSYFRTLLKSLGFFFLSCGLVLISWTEARADDFAESSFSSTYPPPFLFSSVYPNLRGEWESDRSTSPWGFIFDTVGDPKTLRPSTVRAFELLPGSWIRAMGSSMTQLSHEGGQFYTENGTMALEVPVKDSKPATAITALGQLNNVAVKIPELYETADLVAYGTIGRLNLSSQHQKEAIVLGGLGGAAAVAASDAGAVDLNAPILSPRQNKGFVLDLSGHATDLGFSLDPKGRGRLVFGYSKGSKGMVALTNEFTQLDHRLEPRYASSLAGRYGIVGLDLSVYHQPQSSVSVNPFAPGAGYDRGASVSAFVDNIGYFVSAGEERRADGANGGKNQDWNGSVGLTGFKRSGPSTVFSGVVSINRTAGDPSSQRPGGQGATVNAGVNTRTNSGAIVFGSGSLTVLPDCRMEAQVFGAISDLSGHIKGLMTYAYDGVLHSSRGMASLELNPGTQVDVLKHDLLNWRIRLSSDLDAAAELAKKLATFPSADLNDPHNKEVAFVKASLGSKRLQLAMTLDRLTQGEAALRGWVGSSGQHFTDPQLLARATQEAAQDTFGAKIFRF
ncbi:hypothetical protein WDW37_12870 [Bdellovibrionota bacterium FG-1]